MIRPVDGWLIAVIGVGGTLAGAALGVRGALAISRNEHRDALQGEMRRAFAAYLGALYPIVAELRDLPDAPPPTGVERLIDQVRGEAASWVVTRRHARATFGDRPHELMDRLALAAAHLQVLPMTDEVRAAVDAANDYVERLGGSRTPEITSEWPSIYRQLAAAAKALGPVE